MGFSRQEYWSGLPFPSPGSLPNPGIEPRSPTLQTDALPSEPPGKPFICYCCYYNSECLCAYSSISHSDHCLWGKILDGKLFAHLTSLNYLPGPIPGSPPSNSSLSPWPLLEGASPDSGLFWATPGIPDLNPGTPEIQGHRILCHRGCSGYFKMFRSIPGLHPPDTSRTLSFMAMENASRNYQRSLDGRTPLGWELLNYTLVWQHNQMDELATEWGEKYLIPRKLKC